LKRCSVKTGLFEAVLPFFKKQNHAINGLTIKALAFIFSDAGFVPETGLTGPFQTPEPESPGYSSGSFQWLRPACI
jgi:hypothetical protein